MPYYKQQLNMLSTQYRLQLTDILCRIITTDGVPVTLEERVWMNKLIEHNASARTIHDEFLKDYEIVS